MGSSASKASRAAGGAARQYPTRAPPSTTTAARPPPPLPPQGQPATRQSPGPINRPQPSAATSRSDEINLDASDPHFARSLRSLGPVEPNPTLSQSSKFPSPSNGVRGPDPRSNPALAILGARKKLQEEAEQEFMEAGRRGHPGREFLDVFTIRRILVMRDAQGRSPAEIEKALGLKSGCVERLGPAGVVELAQEVGRAEREISMV